MPDYIESLWNEGEWALASMALTEDPEDLDEALEAVRRFGDLLRVLPPEGHARVVTSGPDADLRKIEIAVLEAIATARRHIRLATPYFLPGELVVNALSLAALRGIEVDVVVPGRSDHRFVDFAMRAHVDPLLDAGVRIWLDDPPFDHSKLLVVDGGAPQVNAAAAVLEDLGVTDVAVIGLAKRLEEVWIPGEDFPLILPRTSEALYLLQYLRDESHRFAITKHRKRRSKAQRRSVLDSIPGLGPARQAALLKHFGSVKRIREATPEQIAEVKGVGLGLARTIRDRLTTSSREDTP